MAAPIPQDKKGQFVDKLKYRAQKDPIVFGFLGLTVAALTGGLISLLKDDKRQSQRMMRYRVFFQLCTVGALAGGIYYRAYQNMDKPATSPFAAAPDVDKRVYLTDPRIFDVAATVSTSSGTVEDDKQMR